MIEAERMLALRSMIGARTLPRGFPASLGLKS
jgi:hypothetical protein